MARHIVNIVVIWVILTVLGALVLTLNFFPATGAEFAKDFNGIFRLLAFMGLPVVTFVFAWVGYSFFAFRARSGEDEGPAFWGRNWVPIVWLAVTAALAITVMIYPGLTGLAKLQADPRGYGWGETGADLVVKVTGFRWSWSFEYPQQGITVNAVQGRELVLPVDATVRFEVNSTDVVHSFWIPAFRMKIDAIPGRTTYMVVRPVVTGSFDDDQAFRVQCAELCGLDHGKMWLPVRVVEREEFEAWVQQMKAQ